MQNKQQVRKTLITITLPVDVAEFLYNIIVHEEKVLGIKRNLSAIIYRALSATHPNMPQYDIDLIYNRRRRGILFSTYAQPKIPLLDLSPEIVKSEYELKMEKFKQEISEEGDSDE